MREMLMRLAEMPPEQQQQVLEDDPVFKRMPPHVRERIRQRLEELNQLPPEERRRRLQTSRRGRGFRRGQELFLRVAPLSPEEQEQALAEDELFQSLPLHAQQRLRHHLERFNSQPPEARERELFAGMSPEQRQQARHVFGTWRRLPPERRGVMTERLRRLQQATPEERQALVNDEEFLAPLSEEERTLFRQLWELRRDLPPPPPHADRP
jgi:hypothetical protein